MATYSRIREEEEKEEEEEEGERNKPSFAEQDNNSDCRGGESKAEPQREPEPKRRLRSLDVFRGLAVALMILVDDVGGVLPAINHSPWNDATIADFVMPFFLFIVGVSLGLVYKEVPNKVLASRKVILRALKLFILGIVIQGGYFHGIGDLTYGVDIENIRWLGTLQRIAIGYFFAALCEIWLKSNNTVESLVGLLKRYYMQWLVAFALSVLYLGLLYGLYVPDWKFEVQTTNSLISPSSISYIVKCGVRGNLGPACNAVGMVDRTLLGIKHLYRKPVYRQMKECKVDDAPEWCKAPFDPEGLLSSIMAIVTCFIGLHFGHILVHFKVHKKRISNCMISSLGLILLGATFCICGMPLNKLLYTFSYMCVTSSAAGLVFVAIYLLVDMYGYRRPTMLLEWMGKNALTLYILAACNLFLIAIQGFYWKVPQNNIRKILWSTLEIFCTRVDAVYARRCVNCHPVMERRAPNLLLKRVSSNILAKLRNAMSQRLLCKFKVTYIVQHGPWHHVGSFQSQLSGIQSEVL